MIRVAGIARVRFLARVGSGYFQSARHSLLALREIGGPSLLRLIRTVPFR
jgi:hypothetical protein